MAGGHEVVSFAIVLLQSLHATGQPRNQSFDSFRCLFEVVHTSRQLSSPLLQIFNHLRNMLLLLLENCFHIRKLRFQFDVLLVLDNERRVPDDCAQELFFRDLLQIGEAKFGEEFLHCLLVTK